jgi:ABC-2 type transport system permease protein
MVDEMEKTEYMRHQIIKLLFLVASIILIGVVSNQIFFRIDLTGDKRYTLSDVSREILNDLDDIVFVRVYLDGDLPVGFRRMRKSIREMLDEFRAIAGNRVQYEFIDPVGIDDRDVREDLHRELYRKGLRPANIEISERGGGHSQRLAFPGALVTYKGMEVAVNLLKNNPALSAEQNLNNSVQGLEYELISSFYSLLSHEAKKVAFLEGHGELDELLVAGISDAIVNYYDIYRGRIDERDLQSLDDYDAVIIAKPLYPFSETEKYIIDQYIMNGGKVMWFIDPVAIDLDSLTYQSEAVALVNDLNLDDQLFRYGVRLNSSLVMDMNCLFIPINIALADEAARFVPAPWYYSPLLAGNDQHPVTKGLNYVKSEFASVIDTVGSDSNVKRQVLLRTSGDTKVVNAPMLVSLETARQQPARREYNMPHQPVAVMLEGEFTSVFSNRVISGIIGREDPQFRESGDETRMLVVADGDIIRNDITVSGGVPEPLPLGYDRYSGQTFGNREFIINALNYLLDEYDLMELRTRELQLRLLDRARVREQLTFWQTINLVMPVILVVLSGLIYNWIRIRRFAYRKSSV